MPDKKVRTTPARIPPGSPLIEYRTSTPVTRDHICWDCEKDFGLRYAAVVRGVNENGDLEVVWLCHRCAKKESREVRSGMRPWRRFWCYIGRTIALLSLLSLVTDITGFILGCITWDWSMFFWSLLGFPAFIIGVLLSVGGWQIKNNSKLRKRD